MAALVCGFVVSATTVDSKLATVKTVEVAAADKNVDASPLCQSIAKNDVKMVKKLIEMGVDVNKFSGGKSPLMYAARYNRVEIMKLLVANGAKINTSDSRGNTALKHAENSGANEAVMFLKELRKDKKRKKKSNK